MKAIGIDLGTTNSTAAIAADTIEVLPTRDGDRLTPSVVGYVFRRTSQSGEIVAGRQALNNAIRAPENTVFSVKRLMGRTFSDRQIEEVQKRFNYRFADPPPPEAEDQGVRVLLNDKPYTPVEISARILRQIKRDAELALGEDVTHAVITVPAYFEERQRNATIEAGEKADLKVLGILDEPTAAAIAFGVGKEEEKHRVLVYDLGGGTFDISVIQMTGGQYEVLKISGNNWLGGDDFDGAILRRIVRCVKDEYGYDASEEHAFLSKARVAAERAKIALSTQQATEILDTVFNVPNVGEVDIELEITRDDFEADIRPLVDETVDLVRQALDSQGLEPEDISLVLMVGGSTAVPLVQQCVEEIFGRAKMRRNVNPMECVALGAAIRAASFELQDDGSTTEGEGPHVGQVTPMDLGIAAVVENDPDRFVPIIPRDTPYPLNQPKTKLFYPASDKQNLIRVPVYEGLSKVASLNEQQGVIEFPLPEGIPSTTPVEVSFNYDRNRLLTVGIKVMNTDYTFEETLRRDRPRIKQQQQRAGGLLDDWRDELQPTVRATQHFLDYYQDYMTEEDREEVKQTLDAAQKALDEDNQIEGKRIASVLSNRIMGSGTASQLFVAERVLQDAPLDVQGRMAETIQKLKDAHAGGDKAEVQRLGDALRTAVAKIISQRSAYGKVEDKKDFQDLLRFRA